MRKAAIVQVEKAGAAAPAEKADDTKKADTKEEKK